MAYPSPSADPHPAKSGRIHARSRSLLVVKRDLLILIIALALSVVPLLFSRVPPLTDLPNHMSRYAIGALYARSTDFQRWYDFHWTFIGNLGVDIPATMLAKLIGVEPATKIVIILIPSLAVLGMGYIALAIYGRLTPLFFCAAVYSYNYGFDFGFVNFCFSAGLVLLAFGLWIDMGQRGLLRGRALIFIPLAFVIWTAHVEGWGMLGVIIFGYELASGLERRDRPVRTIVTAMVNCLPLCGPFIPMMAWFTTGLQNTPPEFKYRLFRKIAFLALALRQNRPVLDVAFLCGTLLTFAIAVGFKKRSLEFRLLVPGLLLFIVYAAMPDALLGSGYSDLRLAPYAFILCLLAIRPAVSPRHNRIIVGVSAALYVAHTAYVANTYLALGRHYDRELEALDHISTGSRVFGFARVSCPRDETNDRMDHIHRMATVRRLAFTNGTWPPIVSQTLTVRPEMIAGFTDSDSQRLIPAACRYMESQSIEGRLRSFPRDKFDYLWLIGVPARDWPVRPWLRPIWHTTDGILYRVT